MHPVGQPLSVPAGSVVITDVVGNSVVESVVEIEVVVGIFSPVHKSNAKLHSFLAVPPLTTCPKGKF